MGSNINNKTNMNTDYTANFQYNSRKFKNNNNNINTYYILYNRDIFLNKKICVFTINENNNNCKNFILYNDELKQTLKLTSDTKILNKKNKYRTDVYFFNYFNYDSNKHMLSLSIFIDLNAFSKYSETWYNFIKKNISILLTFNNSKKNVCTTPNIFFYLVIADLKIIQSQYSSIIKTNLKPKKWKDPDYDYGYFDTDSSSEESSCDSECDMLLPKYNITFNYETVNGIDPELELYHHYKKKIDLDSDLDSDSDSDYDSDKVIYKGPFVDTIISEKMKLLNYPLFTDIVLFDTIKLKRYNQNKNLESKKFKIKIKNTYYNFFDNIFNKHFIYEKVYNIPVFGFVPHSTEFTKRKKGQYYLYIPKMPFILQTSNQIYVSKSIYKLLSIYNNILYENETSN